VTTSLTDTYIVENSATETGGGILLEGTLTTSGTVVIASNKPNNCAAVSGSGAVCP
jgi:predicted outer membrane repeat protein